MIEEKQNLNFARTRMINIISKYKNEHFIIILNVSVISICSTFFATLLPIWPQIFDTVLNVNESRLQSHTVYIVTEYFIDKKKYSYLILLHANVTMCIGGTTIIATGTMILGCFIYACGMFKIAR